MKDDLNKKDNYEVITTYFKEKHHFDFKNKIRSVFVLTENGSSTCNKKLSELMFKNKDNESSVFLITVSGKRMDIADFSNVRTKVFYDTYEGLNGELFLNSKVIFVKYKEVDTVIIIDPGQIDKQFKEINKRL